MKANSAAYIGRFAPSPTGPLHAGSLVAALASWLDARAHGGLWRVRIEDVDAPRCRAGAAEQILGQLAACGLQPDGPVLYQSARATAYRAALDTLQAGGWTYACTCTRREVDEAQAGGDAARPRHAERIYPGTCRDAGRDPAFGAIRVLASARSARPLAPLQIAWQDRRLGAQQQDVTNQVGDFVLRRADTLWAYQLAVVVDDAQQGVTDVVRGEDLADNTARQRHLQRVLGVPHPRWLHVPLVRASDGEKLSKRHAAAALDLRDPLAALRTAGVALGIEAAGIDLGTWLAAATAQWAARWLVRCGDPDGPLA